MTGHHWKRSLSLWLLLLLLTHSPLTKVHADTAPEPRGDTSIGTIIHPYDFIDTKVRMIDEQVNIRVSIIDPDQVIEDFWNYQTIINTNTAIYVTASFRMRNLGTVAEEMSVVFPVTDLRCDSSQGPKEWLIFSHEMDPATFTVQVDGKTLATTERTTTSQLPSPDDWMPFISCETQWQQFDVVFPPEQDVRISVAYEMKSGFNHHPWSRFVYILKSGQGWYGTIGQVDIRLELPYPVSPENVSHFPAGYWIQGNTVTWRWHEMEPEQNLYFEIIDGNSWAYLQNCRINTRTHPSDTAAWKKLAEAYWYLSMGDDTFHIERWQFAQQAVAAYQQAIALEPQSAALRYDLGSLQAALVNSAERGNLRLDHLGVQLALRELQRARQLNLKHPEMEQVFIDNKIEDLTCLATPGCQVKYRGP
jgi:hypothetical protein